MKKVVFIGPIKQNEIPCDGVTVKNNHLLDALKMYCNVSVCDTYYWKTRPWILTEILFKTLFCGDATIVLSLNSSSAYRMIRILKFFGKDKQSVYFAAGGRFHEMLKNGELKGGNYMRLRCILVQGKAMKSELHGLGLQNVSYLPNFRRFERLPRRLHRKDNRLRFVFCSRILPEKGCDIVFEAIEKLREYEKQFTIDFYGPISELYENVFQRKISLYENAEYHGTLNLRKPENYDVLAKYDVMLFPTYWDGEGCPGAVLDAYFAGLPVVASDWNCNSEVVVPNETGWLIPHKDADTLAEMMKKLIAGEFDLDAMRDKCQKLAMKFSVENVLSADFFQNIGVV